MYCTLLYYWNMSRKLFRTVLYIIRTSHSFPCGDMTHYLTVIIPFKQSWISSPFGPVHPSLSPYLTCFTHTTCTNPWCLLSPRLWSTASMSTANGTSARCEPSSPDATSSRTLPSKSSSPPGVSKLYIFTLIMSSCKSELSLTYFSSHIVVYMSFVV